MRRALFLLLLLGLAAPAPIHAAKVKTELVSTGPSGGSGAYDVISISPYSNVSDNGRRVTLTTQEPLVPEDTDNLTDVYQRFEGVTTLVSTGPQGSGGNALLAGASRNGRRLFFYTPGRLIAEDTDDRADFYQRFKGVTTLLSTGPAGGNGPVDVCYPGSCRFAATPDGSRVFFMTAERLVAEDLDTTLDLYEHTRATTTLVSIGQAGGNSAFGVCEDCPLRVSDDGGSVFFETGESLVASDTDGGFLDVYERSGGSTRLVSTGPLSGNPNDAYLGGITPDGSRAYFDTDETLTDGESEDSCPDPFYFDPDLPGPFAPCPDVFERSGGITNRISSSFGAAGFVFVTKDGSKVLFVTNGQESPGDYDSCQDFGSGGYSFPCPDVYERSGGTTRLISTGPEDTFRNRAEFAGASENASRVFFLTGDRLLSEDTDLGSFDVYERSGDTTTLVSTGPTGGNGAFHASAGAASRDGSRYVFSTAEPLVSGDTDSSRDVYERFKGSTALLSQGTIGGNGPVDALFQAATPDARRIMFTTREALSAEDTDGNGIDLYLARAP